MTLYLIGLGLSDEKDITIKGLEIVRQCHTVYLESYTSLLAVTKEKLENFYGRPLIEADRELMELSNEILEATKSGDVAVLIVGDPFSATTHTDLVLRAREKNINVEIIHNASIMTAIGVTGLQLYNFGRTVTVPFWTDTWRPTSFYDKIKINLSGEMHTLCLLGYFSKIVCFLPFCVIEIELSLK
jgi:diphthine synthase